MARPGFELRMRIFALCFSAALALCATLSVASERQVWPLFAQVRADYLSSEFYLLDRIEGRTGRDFRSTTHYDDATNVVRCLLRLHEQNVRGPQGYSE